MTEIPKSINNPVSFNIYFNNNNTNAIGTRQNIKFPVDLSEVVSYEDFSKSYKVYLALESTTGSSSVQNIPCYFLDINIGTNFINGKSNLPVLRPRFKVPVEVIKLSAISVINYMNVKFTDNPPIILKSLYNVNYVEFKLFYINGAVVNPFAVGVQYQLHFEEIVD